MSDYSDIKLRHGIRQEARALDPFQEVEDTKALKAKQEHRDNSTVMQKVTAFSDAMSQNNLGADLITKNYANQVAKRFEPDEEWKVSSKFDDEGLDRYMEENGISRNYRELLDGVESQAEFTYRDLEIKRELAVEKSIDETVGSTFRTATGLASSFLGVETLMFGGAGKMYNAGTKISKIAAYEGAAEAMYVGAKFATDDDYTVDDVPLDVLTGLGASVGLAGAGKYFKYRKNKHASVEEETADMTPNVDKSAKMNMKTGAVEPRGDDVAPVIHGKQGVRGAYDTVVNTNKKDMDKLSKLEKEMDDIPRESEPRGKRDYRKKQIKKLQNKTAKQAEDISKLERKVNMSEKDLEIETYAEEVNLQQSVDELTGMNKTAEDIASLKKVQLEAEISHPELKGMDDIKTKEELESFKDKVMKAASLNKKQKIAIVAALTLGGTSLSADEGDGFGTQAVLMATIGALVVVPFAWRMMRSGNAKDWVKRSQERVIKNIEDTEVKNSKEGITVEKTRVALADSMHTKLTSALAGFTGKSKKIMSDLLWDANTGWGAEINKLMDVRAHAARFQDAEDVAFKAWAKANDIATTNSIFMDVDLKRKFREELMDYMETRASKTEGFSEFADELDVLMKEMYDKNKAYQTKGFDKIDYVRGMMPRLWKTGNINNMLGQLGDIDLASVKKAFAEAIHKGDIEHRAKQVYDPKKGEPKPITMGDSEAKAERLVQGWKDLPLQDASRKADDSLTAITQYLKDDVDLDDVLDSLAQQKDNHARTQHRLNLDVPKLKEELAKITVDGEQLNMNMFLDRDVKNVFDKTSNQLHSTAALSSAGYRSKQMLVDAINKSGATAAQKNEMLKVADIMSGNTIGVSSDVMHNFTMVAKDLTIFTKLTLSPISTSQEAMNLIGAHGLTKAMKELAKNHSQLLRNDDKLTKQLQDLTGQGTNTRRYDPSHQGFSDDVMGAEDVDVVNNIRNGTMKMRDITLLPLGAATDMIQSAALKLDSDMLSKKLLGMEEFGSYRWDGVGMSDDIAANFSKDDFVFKDGQLEYINMSKWGVKKKESYRRMLFNMNQRISLEQTVGQSPLFAKTSDLGRGMTTLLGYAMGEFNVHKLQDLKHMDRMAFAHSVAAFGAVYATTYARAGLNGKEVDEDTTLRYALQAITPLGAAASIATTMADPTMFKTTKDIMNVASLR